MSVSDDFSSAYWVAQVCDADACDHRRLAKDGWRAGEVAKESNSGAKKNCRDVDADFVEEASIQDLLIPLNHGSSSQPASSSPTRPGYVRSIYRQVAT